MNINKFVASMLPELREIRHYLHRNPEIRYTEVGTAALVERELRQLPLEVSRIGATGVVGLLSGRRGGKTVALRADMDALEMGEETGLSYASTNGRMHACGHDGNTTVLLGAARVLSAMRAQLRGNVKFIFQPAEELGAGAAMMCDAGVMDRPKVDAIFGSHGFPEVPVGAISVGPGAAMAICDTLYLSVVGRGSHGAHPHQSVDPILVSARIIDALQTIVSRQVSPGEPVVVTIATIKGGFTSNIIPERVEMSGTIRTISEDVRAKVLASIRRIAVNTAAANGAKCKVKIEAVYPLTVNDPAMSRIVERAGADALGKANVHGPILSMGAEDFSFYLRHAPGCYFRLGLGDKDHAAPLHSSHFDYNDKAIAPGVRVMSAVAMNYLAGK